MERAWSPLSCHGNVIVDVSSNFVMSETTVKIQFYTEKVFGNAPFFVIFCVHIVTSQVI